MFQIKLHNDQLLHADFEMYNGNTASRFCHIVQLTIHTNLEAHGPYGGSGGLPFSVDFGEQRLAFISGRSATSLDYLYLHLYC